MLLPRDELIDGADAIEELNILIAHDVEHLSPEQQAAKHGYDQNCPSKLFHSTLRLIQSRNINYHALLKPGLTVPAFLF